MHKLQQHILNELITHQARRFAEMKPKTVESNLFIYHLQKLIDAGLVAKDDGGNYRLTGDGQVYADQLSLESFKPRLQPRIVTLSVVTNEAGEYLLYRRSRQPLIGMVGFPYGKVHVGETIQQAAERELAEKTGLLANLEHVGDGYITMAQGDQVASQILYHLFAGAKPTGRLKSKSQVGQAFWGDPTQVPGWELMPSVLDLIQAAGEPTRSFREFTYQLGPVE